MFMRLYPHMMIGLIDSDIHMQRPKRGRLAAPPPSHKLGISRFQDSTYDFSLQQWRRGKIVVVQP